MTSAVTGRHSNQLNYRAVHYLAACFSDKYYYTDSPIACQQEKRKNHHLEGYFAYFAKRIAYWQSKHDKINERKKAEHYMERTHLFDAALAQKLVDSIAAELNQNVNITDHKGLIIASFDKKRIGTTHEITAKKLAAGEYHEFSISEQEALIYPGVRRGVNVPIIYDHVCYGVVGVTGEPAQASPYARLATKFVTAMLSSLTHKEQWLQVLKEKQRMRSLLLNQLIEVQEEERKRIARELHDETSQALTAALLNLRALAGSLDEPALQQKVLEVRDIVSGALDSIQYMTISLRPRLLDQLGLLPALRKHIETYKKRYPIEIDFQISGITAGTRFFPEIEISIYRIIQEAMNNIMKHAGAASLSIYLSHTGRLLQLQIKDDGIGFDLSILKQQQLQHNSLGIIGMKERIKLLNGQFHISSYPGKGTQITVNIPLPKE